MASKQREMWMVYKNRKNSSPISHPLPFAPVSVVTQPGPKESSASARTWSSGHISLPLNQSWKSRNSISACCNSTHEKDWWEQWESVLDCMFFSPAAFVSKLFNWQRLKKKKKGGTWWDSWSFQNYRRLIEGTGCVDLWSSPWHPYPLGQYSRSSVS